SAAGLRQLAVGVAGAGAPAEPSRRQVGLRQADEEALQARRPAQQDEQQAGREGVEGAGVTRPDAALAADLRDDVRRGDPGRLVVEQHRSSRVGGGHRQGPSWATTSAQRNDTSSSSPRSVEKPAARTWPPPPCLRAIAETSTSPSLERRLTLRAAWPRLPRSRTTAATLAPSIERRWSITPSVISSPAPVAS